MSIYVGLSEYLSSCPTIYYLSSSVLRPAQERDKKGEFQQKQRSTDIYCHSQMSSKEPKQNQ